MMGNKKHSSTAVYGFTPVLVLLTCGLVLAACGGSMGSDPSSGSGTAADPPAGTALSGTSNNTPPTASVGNATGASYSTVTGTLAGSNPCNCGVPKFALVSQPVHGSLTLVDATKGSFTYAPDPGFAGTDSFMFDLGNGQATSTTADETVTISAPTLGAYTAPANIGVNVDSPTYYDVGQQYVDVIYMASGWSSTKSDAVHGSGQNLAEIGELDPNGWPLEDAQIMFLCCVSNDGSAADPGVGSPLLGKYQLSFNGQANIGDDGGKVENQNYDSTTNTTTATLDQTPLHSDGSGFDMLVSFNKTQRTASSPINSGITNVHVIRPQFAPNGTKWWDSPQQEFTDPFLASLAPFSTLRFMDWTDTIGSQEADWDQATPAHWPGWHYIETDGAWEWNATDKKTELTNNWWSNTGQSWQSEIDLANVTGKDIWINIPVRATDDYVKSLATLLKQNLNPGIHVYVEYSNEIWNYNYEEWYYNDAATQALIANNSQEATGYQNNCISWANDTCHVAERLMQISKDFASVWGSPAINAAIRPVFCNQEVGAASTQIALAFINTTYGPPSKYFYGVCSAPYWQPASVTAGESVDDLLSASEASIPRWNGYLLDYTATARYYGLHNFTYEGGPGMTDLNQIDLPNMITANADPRMGAEVTQALTGAFQNGVDMFMYFISSGGWSKYGMWGATDDIMDITQPKWQALQTLAGKSITRTLAVTDDQKAPGPGTTLPGTIDAGQPLFGVVAGTMRPAYQAAGNCTAAANGLPDVCTLYTGRAQGNGEYGYLVVTPAAGTYAVTLKLDDRQGQAAATAQFYVNQQPQGGTISIAASPKGTPSEPATFNITLPAGVSLIELEATSGSVSIDSIMVSGND